MRVASLLALALLATPSFAADGSIFCGPMGCTGTTLAQFGTVVSGRVEAVVPETLAERRQREMLNATVRLEVGSATGSGTVIHSGDDGVYILTNHHVVSQAIDGGMKVRRASLGPGDMGPPGLLMEPVPPAKVVVRSWLILAPHQPAMPLYQEALVIASDEKSDLALLKIKSEEWKSPFVAAIDADDDVEEAESVFVAGAGLGNRPYITEGLVSLTNLDDDDGPATGRMLVSAPTIMGNSGGGAFVERDGAYKFVGVPQAIASTRVDGNKQVIPHIAFVIPMRTVRRFLADNGHGDLIPAPKVTASR